MNDAVQSYGTYDTQYTQLYAYVDTIYKIKSKNVNKYKS